ncbi:MAG: hypothetical protein LBB61_05580 [Treponema sp.]|jgi:hypothetical protein|nr:hypothetical protein [Treponema sp.]
MRYKNSSVEISLESSLISHRISFMIALVCIAVYALALIFAGIRVYRMVSGQNLLAQQEFADFVTYTTAEGNRGFMNERFQTNITNALGLSKTLQAAIISNDSSEYGFERTQETGIVWNGSKPVFKSVFGFSKTPLFAALAIEDQRNVTVRVIYNFFDYGSLIVILKQTLAIVVIGFCISCITLLLRYLLVKDTVPVSVGGDPPKEDDLFNIDTETEQEPDNDSFLDVFDTEDTDSSQDIDDAIEEPRDTEPAILPLSIPEGGADNTPIGTNISEDEFAGLFPKEEEPTYTAIGLNWEANLLEKLQDELHRSDSFDQDLALLIVEIGNERDETVLSALAAEAIDFFVLRDLIFERGNIGIIVIMQDTDIDAGFIRATEFHAKFMGKYPEFSQDLNLFIGISSRCNREVDADRLIREAGAALGKTSEAAPIVAFRVDPEKYKEFLKKQREE